MKFIKNQKYSYLDLSNCIRALAADAIEKANSGHPGMVLGMSDIMTCLAFDFLKFNPNDPLWVNRDKLVLSNGHGSMLLYAFYYLAGYKDFNLDCLKNFRQLNSKTPGHPEYGSYEAIETTTGPLGQGFANAVGMAIAEKKHQQQFGSELSNYKVYCIVGDGCLMEGISYESASIAGHLGLNNLIVLFDDNQISIDGSTNLTISEDQLKKFDAFGWNVESVDGHDFEQIHESLNRAQNSDKPYFISCRTLIAKGCRDKEGSHQSHGSPLGALEIKYLKEGIKFKNEPFFVPEELLEIWRNAWLRNKEDYKKSQSISANQRISSKILNITFPLKPYNDMSTRASSGLILEELIKLNDKVICGSADLSMSNNVKNASTKVISKKDFSGNFIHYGVRENTMAGIMNGLSLSGFLPVGGTFFVFSDYMRSAIRLTAIMHRQVIYIMTHDSIGVGEDGPTHQPIEHLASFRAMPNLLVLRPADFIETLECWNVALSNTTGPSMIVLTRQTVPQIRKKSEENLSSKGGYIISDIEQADITIFATGSELSIAIDTGNILEKSGVRARIVSIPCFELFFKQPKEYIDCVIGNSKLKVAIEAGSSFGWHRIIGESGIFFGIDEFGMSAPADKLYEHFGLTPTIIASKLALH